MTENRELHFALSSLDDAIASNSVVKLDEALEIVLSLSTPLAITPILLRLDDKFEFQEGMWSIMHSAESFDADPYISSLIEAAPKLSERAPDWAATLVKRVLNNTSDRDILKKKLVVASDEKRSSFSRIFSNISNLSPQKFDDKIIEVRGAIGQEWKNTKSDAI